MEMAGAIVMNRSDKRLGTIRNVKATLGPKLDALTIEMSHQRADQAKRTGLCPTVSDLQTQLLTHQAEVTLLRARANNMEDRSRHNNISLTSLLDSAEGHNMDLSLEDLLLHMVREG
ncbi:hypothetical protein NDU88_001523 [Pleurodeles waltl]|uniref:Uncharacterized protein n=1 Tax=Pleurodeles waltl TaxID=8319 RepID=A0AAV7VA39_PLEWA|nr:hypothetical protein NDU88_001523 [Pleurodeles waltl]